MTTPVWQGGALYPPGSLVRPVSGSAVVSTAITNPTFESGDVGWTKTNFTIVNTPAEAFTGTWYARRVFTAGATAAIVSTSQVPVVPGQVITASAMLRCTGADQVGGNCKLYWYTSADVFISSSDGNEVNTTNGTSWRASTVTGTAPATAAFLRVAITSFCLAANGVVRVDNVTWNYVAPPTNLALVYRAVQAATASSGSVEPLWPTTLGLTVVDGGVTWEAVQASRVTWQATPILESGTTQPVWPTTPGAMVADNTIRWETVSRRVEDKNCPNTKVVAILASHVFAADDDIIKFSAVSNPLDWTSKQNAGYLPSGLQQANANSMAVLAPYRANLAALNASSFQLWQADPDPVAMVALDQQEGIGSIWPRAAVAISSDLYYLTALGVRTIGQAAGNNSLSSGDVGMPVDVLVQEAVAAAKANVNNISRVHAAYYPGLGQYLLSFSDYPPMRDEPGGPIISTTTFVYTTGPGGGKWSRYVHPFNITEYALLGDKLYFRHGDVISVMNENVMTDQLSVGGAQQGFTGQVWWNYLDFGTAGRTKRLMGFDFTGKGSPSFSVGFDQRNLSAFTAPYTISADTLPGGIIPLEVVSPTLSLKVDFAAGSAWELSSIIAYVDELRGGW